MSHAIRVRAFAKINLGLKVLFPRRDGYHEIRTIYQSVSLHDRLKIGLRRGPGITIDCDDPAVPAGHDNLVYRACEAWRAARNYAGGVEIELQKCIPVGGGLGGGSSDAAATLMGIERLTGDRLDFPARLRLAASLGSDVPFFLVGGRAIGCGRGEEIYPLPDLSSRLCVIVHPGIPVSTPEAYRELGLSLTEAREKRNVDSFGAWSQFSLLDWGPAENDFERVVFARWPELGAIKNQFIRAGTETALLSGSGSAVYAVFDSARKLNQVSRTIPRGWAAFRTRTLRRREFQRLLFQVSPRRP